MGCDYMEVWLYTENTLKNIQFYRLLLHCLQLDICLHISLLVSVLLEFFITQQPSLLTWSSLLYTLFNNPYGKIDVQDRQKKNKDWGLLKLWNGPSQVEINTHRLYKQIRWQQLHTMQLKKNGNSSWNVAFL